MELNLFFKLLYRQKFVLLGVPLITVIITYFLVRQLPDVYTSKARIATGLVDDSKKAPDNLNFLLPQESKINQQFNNFIQSIQMKKMYDQVSYQLMLHDLTNDSVAFRKPSKLVKSLNKDARKHAIEVYADHYRKSEPLSLFDKDQYGLYMLISSMGYDEESLKKKMQVYRVSNSDFIDIQFDAENADLAAFVPNKLCKEFITYYTRVFKENQLRSVNYLDSLQRQKHEEMTSEMLELKSYKIKNRILNLNEQARVLYGHIADFETKREMAKKDVTAYEGTLKEIDKRFDPKERKYLESTSSKINQDILSSTEVLKSMMDEYIRSNYDEGMKKRLDSMKNAVSLQINQASDKYILNPLVSKENLVSQKLNMEIALDLAKYSLLALQNEIDRLNKQFNSLVPHEATIQSYEKSIDNAGQEYLAALSKFNQTNLETSFTIQLNQIEIAMPSAPGPSKKMLLMVLSGIISFTFCLVVLFILFYLDNDIHNAKQLANSTGIVVLGFLPSINQSLLDLKKLWNVMQNRPDEEPYRNLLRSIRFEIDSEMDEAKTLTVTSLHAGEGKTFLSLSLAYAYARAGEKVLLIDGNFDDPVISKTAKSTHFLEDYLSGQLSLDDMKDEQSISILGNKGGDVSLFELCREQLIRSKMQEMKAAFDVILVEAPSLSALSKSKEWVAVTDKTVAVFEAEQSINLVKESQIDYLKSLHGQFIGWVMNKVRHVK